MESEQETRTALPSPPFINVEGVPNFRDLAGSTPSLRKNHVFRCGDPSSATAAGIKALQELGITHVYDLRSRNEIERSKASGRGGIIEWEGAERIFNPVFEDTDYSPEAIAGRYKDYASGGTAPNERGSTAGDVRVEHKEERWLSTFATQGFTRAYSDILDHAPRSYTKILRHLASRPDDNVVIHCTAGKDRTGLLCALLLSVCDVDNEAVAEEYSLTELGLKDYNKMIMEHLMRNPALAGNRQGALNMISAKKENMLATLDMIEKKFGGAKGYMIDKCGLSEEEVKQLKRNLQSGSTAAGGQAVDAGPDQTHGAQANGNLDIAASKEEPRLTTAGDRK